MTEKNSKVYKYGNNLNISMLPGDLQGSPDESFNSLNVKNQRNAYKPRMFSYFRMFPGDLTGLPDDFFLINYLNLKKFSNHGRNISIC